MRIKIIIDGMELKQFGKKNPLLDSLHEAARKLQLSGSKDSILVYHLHYGNNPTLLESSADMCPQPHIRPYASHRYSSRGGHSNPSKVSTKDEKRSQVASSQRKKKK
ncbi:hypothetical protein [Flavobacterium sp.]|uniref:hypothetical protein n=1 Tax=Flavobacterium sp. TaxID=239 RepID=UPI00261B3C44|nr:hypothetical protein [Flavobacterium sp.]MDD3005861.1 hypothetical protein [Flavobacterium sp.]